MTIRYALVALLASAALTTAQVLTTGNSQLPACAQTCTLLNQAAQACGGTASSSSSIWACFCQSGYLTGLHSSATGICDAFCTDPAQNQQVMTWYQGNCGTDLGASEHSSSAGGATTVVITSTSTSSGATAGPTSSTAAAAAAATGGSVASGGQTTQQSGSWWSNHYKWVIMLIVLFVAFILLAVLAVWLKRRHDRKQDQLTKSFNEGITTRSTPNMLQQNLNSPYPALAPGPAAGSVGVLEPGPPSGRDSPARTRDAFMPYGYGYARSESRLANDPDAIEKVGGRGSPLSRSEMRGGTPLGDLEKNVGGTDTPPASRQKRVLVRERNGQKDETSPG